MLDPTTPADRAEIKAACDTDYWGKGHCKLLAARGCTVDEDCECRCTGCNSTKARTWLPRLVDEVERLEKVVSAAIAYKEHSERTISSLPKEQQDKPMEGRMMMRQDFHRAVDDYLRELRDQK